MLAGDVGAALFNVSRASASEALSLAAEITAVPAPTGEEFGRSAYVAELMPSLGFEQIYRDDIGDVVGTLPGKIAARQLLVAAHLDTVFPATTVVGPSIGPHTSTGPGIGDNGLGVAAALMLPGMLRQAGVLTETDILVTGNVGEEGLGDLRGMKAVMDAHPHVGAVIALEGHNLGRVTHVAVGSQRYRVTVQGPGGHSWGDYGNASAIDAAASVITELAAIPLPKQPKTTLNVGTISGGISVNTIAPDVEFLLDLRSVEKEPLAQLISSVERILESPRSGVRVSYEVIGERPAGVVHAESRIIRLASSILESIGIQPVGDASSTDANIPISRGIPAVCIGITTGGNVHREDEFVDNAPVADGLYQLLALTVAVSGYLAQGQL
ncbi:MAG: M20/M25/M40 family metallo-hydrolase [Thermomicrobiales bacterium]|nr:M20/M25/M40 family metallo-hydrolase [Thermomicrobiales bacterium]